MTKQNPYQIGAPSDKPKFNRNQNSNNNSNSRFNKNRKSFNNDRSKSFNRDRSKSFNNDRAKSFSKDRSKSFNNNRSRPFDKNRPIKKQFNNRPRNNNRDRNNYAARGDNKQRRNFNQNNNRNRNQRFNSNKDYKFNKDNRNKREYNQRENQSLKQQQKNIKNQQQNVKAQQNVKDSQTVKQKQKRIKHNRIIIRNLVFDINANHLRKLLSPFGQILDIHIPTNPDGKGSRGFAFIQFGNRNHALKAIKDLNGTTFKGRKIVLDQSVSKERYLQSKVNEQQKQKDDQKNKKQDLSKVKLQQTKHQKIQQQNNQDQQNDQDNQQNDQQQIDDQSNESQNQVKVEQTKVKKQKTQSQILQDIASEIFIRNLPITVNEQALHQFFRRYGALKFAKIVINRQTGLSKGSAFIKFQDPNKAKQLVQYSRNYQMNLLGKNHNFKLNPAINLQLQGTILKLFPVESRVNISQKLKDRQQKQKKRQQNKKDDKKKKPIKKVKNLEKLVQYDPNDKRNLKLALLGLNKVTQDMRQKDQQRFMNHEKEKLQKLKNPNNSVSDKRIVLKYLSKDITQQTIRNLCRQYLQQTQHKQNDLTYCKLMLQSLETKKSAGFAFVEFKTHEISLGFLQWISQQPKKLMNQPYICQFAIQDSRKMIKLQNKNKKNNQPTNNSSNNKTKTIKKNKNRK